MTARTPDYTEVARVMKHLSDGGLQPVLIGGIALVVHGSTRATRDCDYALEKTETAIRNAVKALFEAGYGIVFGWNGEAYEPKPEGVQADENALGWAVAAQPESIWFWHEEKRIRIDLVFEIPIPIEDLRARATRLSIAGQTILLASPEDLLVMKEHCTPNRQNPLKKLSDEQDLVFLRGIIAMKKETGR